MRACVAWPHRRSHPRSPLGRVQSNWSLGSMKNDWQSESQYLNRAAKTCPDLVDSGKQFMVAKPAHLGGAKPKPQSGRWGSAARVEHHPLRAPGREGRSRGRARAGDRVRCGWRWRLWHGQLRLCTHCRHWHTLRPPPAATAFEAMQQPAPCHCRSHCFASARAMLPCAQTTTRAPCHLGESRRIGRRSPQRT